MNDLFFAEIAENSIPEFDFTPLVAFRYILLLLTYLWKI